MSIGEQRRATDLAAAKVSSRARLSYLLLVEDSPSLLLSQTGILEREGFAVTGCASGRVELNIESFDQMDRSERYFPKRSS